MLILLVEINFNTNAELESGLVADLMRSLILHKTQRMTCSFTTSRIKFTVKTLT